MVLEWISYNQFNDIKEITKNELKNEFASAYSAIWKDGPLECTNQGKWIRTSSIRVTLYKSQNTIKEFLYEV